MSRFTAGVVLPVPPIVAQRSALLPDGQVDPANTTDCGEACVASVLEVASGYRISPGCVRQALGEPRDNGRTVASELSRLLTGLGVPSWIYAEGAADSWEHCAKLRHYGFYRIVLGYWLTFPALHWVLAYERTSRSLRVMDPWGGEERSISEADFQTHYASAMVVAQLS